MLNGKMGRQPSSSLQWIAIHRHDLRIDDATQWRRFVGILHNGFQRQLQILTRNRRVLPHSTFAIAYVYPYALHRQDTGEPERFASWGSLLEDTPSSALPYLHESRPTHTPTAARVGYWVDWRRVESQRIISHARNALLGEARQRVKFWFVDNIPDWYGALRRFGRQHEFADQVRAFCQLLRVIHEVPIVGNVYQGGTWLGEFLEIADGAFFENWQWHWTNGATLLNERARQTIAQAVDQTLQRGKHLWLNVPFLTEPMVDHFRQEARALLVRTPANPIRFCEHRNHSNDASRIAPSTLQSV